MDLMEGQAKHKFILKIGLTVLLVLANSLSYSRTYYVATDGNDIGPGTKAKPWATWGKAFRAATKPGDTTFIRGGVYYTTEVSRGNSAVGTAAKPICYFAYPGETPILDGRHCTTTTEGIVFHHANYVKLKGLTVRNFYQLGYKEVDCVGIYFYKSGHVTIEQCTVHDIGYRGFYFFEPDSLFVYNCDSYNIVDSLSVTPGNAGDGYIMTHDGDTTDYALFRGCRAWQVSDDGWDVHTNGYIEIDSCWAFKCGGYEAYPTGNGLKLNLSIELDRNMVTRKVTNCLLVYNRNMGVKTNDNDNVAIRKLIYNNTSAFNGTYGHKGYGYAVYNTSSRNSKEIRREFINNVSFANTESPILVAGSTVYTHSNNTWDSDVSLDKDDFIHLDSTGIQGERKADGSLPDLNGFLELKPTSDLIDAGTDVGLSYYGQAPDMGAMAFEYESESKNRYPSVQITRPGKGRLRVKSEPIEISVNTYDVDGYVVSVEYFSNDSLIGRQDAPPWNFQWYNASPGLHNLRAVCTDNAGARTTSSEVSVEIPSDQITLYPNPNGGIFTFIIGAPFQMNSNVTIISLGGAIIYRDQLLANETRKKFELPHLGQGIYFLVVSNSRDMLLRKFIKSR